MTNAVEVMDHGQFGQAALQLLPNFNLTGRTLKLFEAMAQVRLRDEIPDAMRALDAYIQRRNGIAHRGEEVTREDAAASVKAVQQVTQAVHVFAYRALEWEDDLEVEERQRREDEGIFDEDEDI